MEKKNKLLGFIMILLSLLLYYNRGHAESIFHYTSYSKVLKTYVDPNGMMNYKLLKKQRNILDQFARQLNNLKEQEYKNWTHNKKIAFWINAYNGLTLQLIINHYPIESSFFKSIHLPENSIRQISGAWDEITFPVMGKPITLDFIEHKILRKQFNEPRIHMALVCAAMSCPPLRNEPYTEQNLDYQLNDQTKKFMANKTKFKINHNDQEIYLSKIFKWFGKDFIPTYYNKNNFPDYDKEENAVLNFLGSFLSQKDNNKIGKSEYHINYMSYDWSLNEQ